MIVLASLLAATAAARVFDYLPTVPTGWKEIRPALEPEPISLRIALHQQHRDALEQAVLAISTPGNPRYGEHMSREELQSFTAPSATAISKVSQWLREKDIQFSSDNDWIIVRTDVGRANELLSSRFSWYQHDSDSNPVLRTLFYSVPDDVASFVDLVQPTTRFGQLGAQKSSIFKLIYMDDATDDSKTSKNDSDDLPDNCSSIIAPDCLKELYNINYTASASGNLVAVASFLDQYGRYSDLQSFQDQYLPEAKGQNFSIQEINGGLSDQNSDLGSGNLSPTLNLPILSFTRGSKP
jgi:tripeptidyl-peptidase I